MQEKDSCKVLCESWGNILKLFQEKHFSAYWPRASEAALTSLPLSDVQLFFLQQASLMLAAVRTAPLPVMDFFFLFAFHLYKFIILGYLNLTSMINI